MSNQAAATVFQLLWARQEEDFLEARAVSQQGGRGGFGQPTDVGFRIAPPQGLDQAGGHDHIAEGGESDDEDAARGG